MFDVTLATNDGHQIQDHKIILVTGSKFFSEVFSKCSQTNLLVYLKGITRTELDHILNFIYNGETFVAQGELSNFIETAQELKVRGLEAVEEDKSTQMIE